MEPHPDGSFVCIIHPMGTEGFFSVRQQLRETISIDGKEYPDCVINVIFITEAVSVGLVDIHLDEQSFVVRCKITIWDDVWKPTNMFYNHVIARNGKGHIKIIKEGEPCDEQVGIGALTMPSGAASSGSSELAASATVGTC